MQRTIDRVGRLHVSGRHGHAAHVGRDRNRHVSLLHGRQRAPGAARRRPGDVRDPGDRGDRGCGRDRHQPGAGGPLDPSLCRRPRRRRRSFSRRRPTWRRERAPDVGDVSGIDIASCIPVAARAHVLLETSEPEHRTITAAFIDLMDTDRLLDELGPEGLADRARRARCARSRRRRCGTRSPSTSRMSGSRA